MGLYVTKMLRSSCIFLLANLGGGERLNGDSFKKPTNHCQLIHMKKTFLALALVAGLTLVVDNSNAALTGQFFDAPGLACTMSNVIITPNSFSFSLSGYLNLPNGASGNNGDQLRIMAINTKTLLQDTNWITGNDIIHTPTGDLTLGNSVFTRADAWSYGQIQFWVSPDPVTGSAISGNLSFTLNGNNFNPTYYSQDAFVIGWTGGQVDRPNELASTLVAAPEPSTYALFGIGALALVVVYRRKKTA